MMPPFVHMSSTAFFPSRIVAGRFARKVCVVALLADVVCPCLAAMATAQESAPAESHPSAKRTKDPNQRRKEGDKATADKTANAARSDRSTAQNGEGRAADAEKNAPRPRRRGPRIDQWVRMDDVEEQEFEAFVEAHFPDVWAEVRANKKDKPRVYKQWMIKLAPQLVPLMEEIERNPQRGTLSIKVAQREFRIRRLVSEYLLEKDKTRRASLVQQITTAVTERFDARQERRGLDIASLEDRLERQRELHREKNANRKRIIRREVNAILNPAGTEDESEDDAKSKDRETPEPPE